MEVPEESAGAPSLSPRKHIPGLDVMRGLAIAGVLCFHGLFTFREAIPADSWQRSLLDGFYYGRFGVHLFFVLSGFLITGILVDSKGKPGYYKSFYLRRILRIVPAYLLMIVILKLSIHISTRYVLACLLYVCNMPSLLHVSHEYGPFWSLSVEEQFYLVWPFIVKKASLNALRWLTILLVLGVPVLRYGLQFAPSAWSDIDFKTWDVADFFGGGAALALLVRSEVTTKRLWQIAYILLGISVVGFLASAVLQNGGNAMVANAFYLSPFVALFSFAVLLGYLLPRLSRGLLGQSLVFLGNISYGLYLCHQLIFDAVDSKMASLESSSLGPFGQLWFRFACGVAISVLVAWISRITFEEYFLKLKKRFPEPQRA